MTTFDLEQFQSNLTAAIVDGGHRMDMLLVLSQLIANEDVKALFADKVDISTLHKMLKAELHQRLEEKDRRDEHVAENRDSENFEYSKYKSGQDHGMKERVHALINAVELRRMAEGKAEVTAVDVLKEALRTTIVESIADTNPTKAIVGSFTGIGGVEYAGVKTLEILEIKPKEFFPELKQKMEAKTKELMTNAAENTAEFISAVIGGIEKKHPGAVAAIAGAAGALAGGKKEHPRIN